MNIKETAQTNNSEEDKASINPVDTGDNAGASEENEVQFDDGVPTGEDENKNNEPMETQPKPKAAQQPTKQQQPQKTNADFARERRKAEQEKALRKARYDAIMEALDGVNPYTDEKMVDGTDVEEYLLMRQIEKSGKDPVADYSKFVKGQKKEQIKQQEELSSQKEWIENDKQDFSSKHPDVNLDNLLQDDLFKNFALGKVGKFSMDKIYTDYMAFQAKFEEQARDRASQILANSSATPGELAKNSTPSQQKSFSDMSSSEINDIIERVKRGEKIK